MELQHYISILEGVIGKKAKKDYVPMQPGDVPDDQADVSELEADVGFKPSVPLEEGLRRFYAWYRDYYGG